MKPLEFPLLADENINPAVVESLARQGKNVRSIGEEGLLGRTDTEIIRHARSHGQVVLTHDSDFGKLAFAKEEPFVGVIFVRPGHISATYVIEALLALESSVDVAPPFVIVAERKGDRVRVRLRALAE